MDSQYKVLVIDDSPFIFKAVKKALEPVGFNVVDSAVNGQIGIEMVEKYDPDIITLDVTMPIMDGLETAKVLFQKNPNRKIIMLSAMGDEKLVNEAKSLGVRYFLSKPFKPEELQNIAKTLIQESGTVAPVQQINNAPKDKFGVYLQLIKKAFEEVTIEVANTPFKLSSTGTFNVAMDTISPGLEFYNKFIASSLPKMAIVIGITGKSKGRIILQCDLDTATNFSEAMNFGDPLEDPNDIYVYMSEFANILCGRSATYINNEFKEREVWLCPPALFSSRNLEVITPDVRSDIIHYVGDLGGFIVDVGFEGDL